MDRFFAILADGVHHFEGTVNQYTGYVIMALFGTPIAWSAIQDYSAHSATSPTTRP